MTREDLAKALGLEPTALTTVLHAAVRRLLDIAERPVGIDRGETCPATVSGHAFLFGFMPQTKRIHWNALRTRLGHEAALVIGPDAAAAFQGDPEAKARFGAQVLTPAWSEHFTRLADIHARRHELMREVCRFGVRGWTIDGCAPAQLEKLGRDDVLTEDSVDRLEARGLVSLVAEAVLAHWALTDAEKKS